MMVAESSSDLGVQSYFTTMENKVRALLRSHLEPFVNDDDMDLYIDAIRVFLNGVVLSSVEHPHKWTRARQIGQLEFLLDRLGLPRGD